MIWILTLIIGWLALGYLGVRYMLKINEISHGESFGFMLFGPFIAGVAFMLWIAKRLQNVNTKDASKKFFHVK